MLGILDVGLELIPICMMAPVRYLEESVALEAIPEE
jgi:hypothetical protein